MRKTQEAEQLFRAANSASARFKSEDFSNDVIAYHQFMSQGMVLMAASIRDVYDKLEAIHSDIRALSTGR